MVSVVYGSTLSRRLKLRRSNIPWLCLFSVFSACPCGVGKSGWRWSLILVSMITSCCNKTKVTNKSRRRAETLRCPSLGDRFKRPLDRFKRPLDRGRCWNYSCAGAAGAGAAPAAPAEGRPTQIVAAHITYSHVFFSPHLPNGIWLCDMAAQPCSR